MNFRILLSISALLCALSIRAQVGVNTTTPNAQLEIKSSNEAAPANTDGLIIPKVNAFPATNPTAAQQGMMVYLTTASGANAPGFYYWDNLTTSWVGVGKTTSNAWGLTGNAGTSAATNFFGTTDNVDLIFRRNTVNSGRISANNVHFGVSSGAISAGTSNAFFGSFSGLNNTIGSSHTFIGTSAGSLNVSGSKNTALGQNANFGGTALTNATAIGSDAMVGTSNSMVLGSVQGLNAATASCSVAIGTPVPTAAFEVSSTSRGVLIPRVALTAANVQAPIANPQGGTLPESTLIYNTATAGVSPNNVYPGFYYWDATRWVRFDVNGENNAKYYTVVGTTSVSSTSSYTLLPQMTLTFTPNNNVVMVHFSASSLSTTTLCSENAVFFQLLLNGVPVTGWQTTAETPGGVSNSLPIWSTSLNIPVSVTAGITQTISVNWATPCAQIISAPNNTFSSGSGQTYFSNRSLTVVDPNGGGGIVGTPPVTTNMWSQNGNTGTNSGVNFVGTADFQPLVLKSNNFEGLRISTNGNVGMGTTAPSSKLHVVGNIRMVDGNQATGKVLTSDAFGTATWQNPTETGWGLNGNLGTSAATNFMGTTDNQDVVFKRNNIFSGKLGDVNTSFGFDALSLNTIGTLNSAFGTGALHANTNGSNNIALGSDALSANTFANRNIAIGNSALLNQSFSNSNTSWNTYNIAIGHQALQANQPTSIFSANNNVAVGDSALMANLTGFSNTALGNNTLKDNTTGFDNLAVGYNALTNNTTGNDNVAVGVATLVTSTSGSDNTALGRSALFDNTTGSNNTAAGSNALANVTSGTNNTALGKGAFLAITQGNNNTALGAETSATSTIFENATAIGYKATVGNSNVMVLGSINGVNGATASVSVGIGTTTPQSPLEVARTNLVTSSTGEGILHVRSSSPQAIDIGGSITLGGSTDAAGATNRVFGSVEGRKSNATAANASGYLIFKTNNNVALSERMRITDAGDVGIGTATPGGQLELSLNEGRKPGTNTWTIVSDARLKEVSGSYEKGLNEIAQLRPIRYHYKNVGGRTFEQKVLDEEFSGFLAQEVQRIFPEAVGTDPDGYLNFNMHSILVASVNAIKELDMQNQKLQQENEVLKTQLAAQQEKLDYILLEIEKIKNR